MNGIHNKNLIREEPYEANISRTVLKTSRPGDWVAEFNSPYIYPAVRLTPDKDTTVNRRDRSVQLVHQKLESLIIPKKSDAGQTILSLVEEYKNALIRYQDEVAIEPPDDLGF